MKDLFADMQKIYPDIIMENQMETLSGDETLIKCLISNLIANAVRVGRCVVVAAQDNVIIVQNDGEVVTERKLKYLNKNYMLPKEELYGNGYGVNLCHEIVKLHRGKLLFRSDEERGTVVRIEF